MNKRKKGELSMRFTPAYFYKCGGAGFRLICSKIRYITNLINN